MGHWRLSQVNDAGIFYDDFFQTVHVFPKLSKLFFQLRKKNALSSWFGKSTIRKVNLSLRKRRRSRMRHPMDPFKSLTSDLWHYISLYIYIYILLYAMLKGTVMEKKLVFECFWNAWHGSAIEIFMARMKNGIAWLHVCCFRETTFLRNLTVLMCDIMLSNRKTSEYMWHCVLFTRKLLNCLG